MNSGSSVQGTLHALQNEFAGMARIVRVDCAEEYHSALKNAQVEKGEVL